MHVMYFYLKRRLEDTRTGKAQIKSSLGQAKIFGSSAGFAAADAGFSEQAKLLWPILAAPPLDVSLNAQDLLDAE